MMFNLGVTLNIMRKAFLAQLLVAGVIDVA
jgi:hypothetical protein